MAPKSGSLNNPKISLSNKRVKARFPLTRIYKIQFNP